MDIWLNNSTWRTEVSYIFSSMKLDFDYNNIMCIYMYKLNSTKICHHFLHLGNIKVDIKIIETYKG